MKDWQRRSLRRGSWFLLKIVGSGPGQLICNRASWAIWEPSLPIRLWINCHKKHKRSATRIRIKLAIHPKWDGFREKANNAFPY